MTGSTEVVSVLDGGVLTLRIDRPDRGNALTPEVVADLGAHLDAALTDPTVRVVVLTGTPGVFCTGADLGNRDRLDDDALEALLHEVNGVITSLVELPKPVVAAADGLVIGAGVSLALAADLLLVSTRTRLRLGFSGVGLMPDGGAAALLGASIGRARAQRMVLLDEQLDADALVSVGLAGGVIEAESFAAGVAATTRRLAAGPAVALARGSSAVNRATLTELDASFAREVTGQMHLMGCGDFGEAVDAFVHRRAPRWGDRPPTTRLDEP